MRPTTKFYLKYNESMYFDCQLFHLSFKSLLWLYFRIKQEKFPHPMTMKIRIYLELRYLLKQSHLLQVIQLLY